MNISMIKYTNKIFEDFPEDIHGKATTPAVDHLFKVREDRGKKLPEELAQAFHSAVAQLVFLCKRACPNTQTPVSFLMKGVQELDADDWDKLKCVLKYLKSTLYMKRVLSTDSLHSMKWWVDASYDMHWDMKGHMEMMKGLGKGEVMSAFLGEKSIPGVPPSQS